MPNPNGTRTPGEIRTFLLLRMRDHMARGLKAEAALDAAVADHRREVDIKVAEVELFLRGGRTN